VLSYAHDLQREEKMIDPLLIGLGLFVGTLIGLTGIGGGALLTPLLILVVGVSPMRAVGTDLAFAALTKLVGACQHQWHGTSDLRLVGRLALGSVPGALLGSWLVSAIETANVANMDVLFTRLLGLALIVSAGASLLRVFGLSWGKGTHADLGPVTTTALGMGVGVMVGITSIGAGSLLMAAFALFYKRLPIAQAVGVDVMHGAVLALAAAIAHGAAGRIEVPMVTGLLIGSLPGVILGSWLCRRLPSRPLRVGIAAMLAISGARLL
jgi:uncharacterized membrane protein YfcA